ncbi:hypothetical protein KEG38_47440 [Polyangium jinanense]|uniref:hypothetical protein n=1 Tax=Polyangium jinanense TaxID=2829994 RepID=UPI002340E93C|nr:hypothetical protein [Polyangium jinanense]MDC3961544.1 hypothetical protein [Polyangium jinanense]
MGDFESLRGMEGRLYRGFSHPVAVKLACTVGVGPSWQVANVALEAKAVDDEVCDFLISSLKKILAARHESVIGFIPPALGKQEYLRTLIASIGGTAIGSLEMADHVMHDYDALLKPDVGRSTDSVTLSPRVAILYAYGIKTDDFFEKGAVTFFSGKTTAHPHVALLDKAANGHAVDGPAFEQLHVWYEKRDDPDVHATVDEVKKRVGRDEERLLRDVAPAEKVIPLPPFDEDKPGPSLDAAADRLRDEGVAV